MRPRKTTCGAAPAGRRVTGEMGTGLGSEVRRASGAIAASRLRISSPSAITTSARASVAAMTRRSGAGARSWKRWKRPECTCSTTGTRSTYASQASAALRTKLPADDMWMCTRSGRRSTISAA